VYRCAELSDEVRKLRPPRYIQSDGIVRSYVYREAEGHQILQVIWNAFLSLRRRKLCFRVVRPCVRACVRPPVIHVVVLCFRDISSICWRIFAKLLSLLRLGTEMNWLDFVVKRSKFKVMAWPNASKIFMFPLYLQYLLIDFRQTFVAGASRDRDELTRFWGQKVKGQGHSMTEYIPDFYVSAISPVSVNGFSPNFCHWCILGHRWPDYVFGSKGQRSRSHHRGGGAQHSTLPSSATFSSLIWTNLDTMFLILSQCCKIIFITETKIRLLLLWQ